MGTFRKFLQKLTWFERKIKDPYNPEAYAALELFVPKPTRDHPYPCILVSIRNGHDKLFFRVANVEEYLKAVSISRFTRAKLKNGLISANIEADEIEKDMRLIMQRRRLPEGARIVRTDTGEVIAEAERIIKEAQG